MRENFGVCAYVGRARCARRGELRQRASIISSRVRAAFRKGESRFASDMKREQGGESSRTPDLPPSPRPSSRHRTAPRRAQHLETRSVALRLKRVEGGLTAAASVTQDLTAAAPSQNPSRVPRRAATAASAAAASADGAGGASEVQKIRFVSLHSRAEENDSDKRADRWTDGGRRRGRRMGCARPRSTRRAGGGLNRLEWFRVCVTLMRPLLLHADACSIADRCPRHRVRRRSSKRRRAVSPSRDDPPPPRKSRPPSGRRRDASPLQNARGDDEAVCTDGATFRRYDRVIRPASSPQDDDEAAYRALSRSSANGGGARQAPSRTRSARSRATVRGGTRLRRLGKRGKRKQRHEKTAPFRKTRISAPSSLLAFGWLVGWLVGWLGGCRDIFLRRPVAPRGSFATTLVSGGRGSGPPLPAARPAPPGAPLGAVGQGAAGWV